MSVCNIPKIIHQTWKDNNIPEVVEIPRKIYKKGKAHDVVVEIKSVKINKCTT